MTLVEAMKTNKPFRRPHLDYIIQYHLPKTGPFASLVSCSYFTIIDSGDEEEFSTSLDLYPEDIFATDYILA